MENDKIYDGIRELMQTRKCVTAQSVDSETIKMVYDIVMMLLPIIIKVVERLQQK